MRVVLDNHADAPEDLELRLGREDATVGDLLDALPDAARARGIVLDGRFCHVDLALTEIGLYEGARIQPADGAPEGREAAPRIHRRFRADADGDATGRRRRAAVLQPGFGNDAIGHDGNAVLRGGDRLR